MWGDRLCDGQALADLPTRALQMRVLVIGRPIRLVLRFDANGLLAEKAVRHE